MNLAQLATDAAGSGGQHWLSILSASGAILAALVAGVFAWRTQRSAAATERVRRLEEEASERRRETYEPLIEHFAKIIDPKTRKKAEQDTHRIISEQSTWLSIYGSDDAVVAFQRFMQAAYADAPGKIVVRLYAEFVLAARRDMGRPASTLNAIEFLGIRMNDAYTNPEHRSALTGSFDDLCRSEKWTPPWA